jgi:hypothetical protein
MHLQHRISDRSAPLFESTRWSRMYRCEDPNPLNHPDDEEDVPMPPDDPARKAPIDEPPSPNIPKRA